MDHHAQTHVLWEHTCCQTRRWSASPLCDRCGAQASATIRGVSLEDAMTRLNSLDHRPVHTRPQGGETAAPPVSADLNIGQGLRRVRRTAVDERRRLAHRVEATGLDDDEHSYVPPTAGPLHPDLERAFMFGYWLLSGLVSAVMGIGAVVEFDRTNYVSSILCAVGAAAGPTSVIAFAIDAWVRQHRSNVQSV